MTRNDTGPRTRRPARVRGAPLGLESWPVLLGTILIVSVLPGCGASSGRQHVPVRLAGAQVALELVDSWLERADAAQFAVGRVEPVYLSQHGFEALSRGTADLACADRLLSERERQDLFAGRPVEGYRVAFYGFALYVNLENPLDSIFAGHLKLLFQKKLTQWNELAARPIERLEGPIRLVSTAKSTRAGEILKKQANIWFAEATWEVVDSDAAVIAAVRDDPLALGFASVGLDQGVRYLALRMERDGPPVLPSIEAIESERYGLAKVIYVYCASPAPLNARAALDYLFSEAGARAIEHTRLWPLPRERARLGG